MMMKKTLLLIIFIILLVLSIGTVSATNETDTSTPDITNTNSIVGENTENNNIIILSNENAQKSMTELENTIKNNKNTTIILNDNYQWTEQDTNLKDGIIIDKSIIIDGQDHKIDVNHKMRIFKVTNNDDVTFKNINFLNGGYDHMGGGGAVWNYETKNITIINCMFNGNIAAYGGAIYNDVNKPLTIINCSFNNNNACGKNGGAIHSESNVYIENSLFNSNHADEDGGAIFCCNNAYITDCLFESNKVNGAKVRQCEGGAIYCKEDLTVENSTFKNNYVDGYGGAIYANKIYVNNNQESGKDFNSFFINNVAIDNDGGALYSLSEIYMKNTLLFNNSAHEDGGAIFCDADGTHLTHCLFNSNKAEGAKYNDCDGGAVYCKYKPLKMNDLIINNCTFINNFATDYGGAIYAVNVYVNNNQGSGENFKSFFINNTAKNDDGGAICTVSIVCYVVIFNSEFSDNNAGDYGGAIRSTDIDVINSTFTNNNAQGGTFARLVQGGGGALYGGHIEITNSQFKNNHADDSGGAIHSTNTLLLKGENLFLNNKCENHGGAIYTGTINSRHGDHSIDVENVTFTSNYAGNDGGAIYINHGYDGTFTYCIFEKNIAEKRGGAIFIDSHFSDVKLTKNMFIENYASSGNSGFTCNVGGVFGDAFILGPNYYGESDNSREGQFSYSKVDVEFVPDIMSEHVGMPDSGYDQKVQTWFRNPLDIYTDNAVVENTSTFDNVARGLNQIADIINVPISLSFTPGLGDIVIRLPLNVITFIKDLF